MGLKARIRRIMEAQLNKRYAAGLAQAKRRISYEEWLKLQEAMAADGAKASKETCFTAGVVPGEAKVCAGTGEPLRVEELAKQGIYLILQRRGRLDPQAPSWIAGYFDAHPETQLLYGDEDVLSADGKHRLSPYFKPDWSPDTWLSCFYPGSVIALRRELAEPLMQELSAFSEGGAEGIFFYTDTAQLRMPVHRLLESAGGFNRGSNGIAHLPRMLFHMEQAAAEQGLQRKYRQADGFDRQAEMGFTGTETTISAIIPSKDNPQVLEQCLEALSRAEKAEAARRRERGFAPIRLEILVVDNGSNPGNKEKIEKITCGMKYIYRPMPFNFSKMCNLGAEAAAGELLLFLNDDITVCEDCWLAEMADRALRPYVGAVGLKLYYPDSRRIQHAGIFNLPGGPVHKLQFTEDGQEEDWGYGGLDRNVIGVTGACLMVQRERFLQAGGFIEELQVAYNDVELCFSLREAGWHNVVLNRYHAYHHESLSRGNDLTREKMLRLRQERQLLYTRHPAYRAWDPYYPEPLCRELGDTHIYENYLDIQAPLQSISRCGKLREAAEREAEKLLFSVRLTASPKQAGEGDPFPAFLQGYIVVQWENNACYRNCILLQNQKKTDDIYILRLEPRYSWEAEYDMQEQPNTALCGFQAVLQRGVLPDGCYRIGVQAKSRLGRRRLTAWTEQTLHIREGVLAASCDGGEGSRQ